MTNKKKRQPPRVALPCPDCAATYHGRELTHELSCPLAAAVERACDVDRWIHRTYPTVTKYRRPISRAELAQLAHIEPGAEAAMVIVSDMSPFRVRGFADIDGHVFGLVLDIDDVA